MVSSVSWFERLSFITTKKPWWLRQESQEAESLSQKLFHLSSIRLVFSESLPLSRTPLLTLHYSCEASSQTHETREHISHSESHWLYGTDRSQKSGQANAV